MTSDNVHTPVRYPSDLSDEEWAIIEQVLNELDPYKTGRRRDSNLREILNAIFYLNKTGCPWRYLPKDFPPYTLVNSGQTHLKIFRKQCVMMAKIEDHMI
jgi:putative transposase